MSSSESDDDAFDGKQDVKRPKQQEKVSRNNALYQNLLNSNNKFSEMLKNKIKQSVTSPTTKPALNDTKDYDFNPVASSTQIGTPNELKHIQEKPLRKVKPSIPLKLTKPSGSSSGSSSDEGRNKSKNNSKTEVINISSTVARGDSSSSESDYSIKESKSSPTKPINLNSSSYYEQTKSKNSGYEESTSNTDSDVSKKLTQTKNKKSNRSSSSSKRPSPEKTSKPAKLKRKSSISSEETSETDKEKTSIKKKVVSKKTREKHVSSSEEDSFDESSTHNTNLVTKGQQKAFYQKSSSYSGSESEDLTAAKPNNNKAHILKIIGKRATNLKHNNSSFQEKPKKFTKTTDSRSSSEEDEHTKSNKNYVKKHKHNSSNSSSDSDSKNKPKKKPVQHARKNVPSTQLATKKRRSSSSSSEGETTSVKKPRKKESDESSSEGSRASNRVSDNSSDEKPARGVESTLSRLKKYEKEKRLQKLKGANDFLNDVHSNEEVYLLQVPIKIDPKSLVGLNISLSDTMRIPQLKKYESVPVLDTQGSVSLFCNSEDERIRILKPLGCIKIQRHLKDKSIADMPKTHNDSVSFPPDLKERHPLFGSEFCNKINLEEHIKQKLEAAVATYTKKKKKKEKKKKGSTKEKQEQQEEEIFKYLNQSLPSSDAPAKNSKISVKDNNVDEKTHSKKKKKHRESDSQPSTSSANESFRKIKKKDKERYQSIEGDDVVDGKKRKNKDLDDSKAKKKPKLDSRNHDPLIQQLLINESATLYKKKKKKRKKSEMEDE